jgi:hypothetical protein
MLTLLKTYPLISEAVIIYVGITAIGTMPTPSDKSGGFYRWAFSFLHAIGAGVPRLVSVMAPQSKIAVAIGTVNPITDVKKGDT